MLYCIRVVMGSYVSVCVERVLSMFVMGASSNGNGVNRKKK